MILRFYLGKRRRDKNKNPKDGCILLSMKQKHIDSSSQYTGRYTLAHMHTHMYAYKCIHLNHTQGSRQATVTRTTNQKSVQGYRLPRRPGVSTNERAGRMQLAHMHKAHVCSYLDSFHTYRYVPMYEYVYSHTHTHTSAI